MLIFLSILAAGLAVAFIVVLAMHHRLCDKIKYDLQYRQSEVLDAINERVRASLLTRFRDSASFTVTQYGDADKAVFSIEAQAVGDRRDTTARASLVLSWRYPVPRSVVTFSYCPIVLDGNILEIGRQAEKIASTLLSHVEDLVRAADLMAAQPEPPDAV